MDFGRNVSYCIANWSSCEMLSNESMLKAIAHNWEELWRFRRRKMKFSLFDSQLSGNASDRNGSSVTIDPLGEYNKTRLVGILIDDTIFSWFCALQGKPPFHGVNVPKHPRKVIGYCKMMISCLYDWNMCRLFRKTAKISKKMLKKAKNHVLWIMVAVCLDLVKWNAGRFCTEFYSLSSWIIRLKNNTLFEVKIHIE